MPRFLLQREEGEPFSLDLHHDFATGERLNSRAPQKQSLFCRVVDLCGKREGAAIDFFGAQEANIL
jgi:hypothetical protein